MNRLSLAFAPFAVLLMLSGCHGAPQQPTDGKKVAAPIPAPVITGTEAQREADEKLWREVEEKKRKSKAANLNKTKAYQNYLP